MELRHERHQPPEEADELANALDAIRRPVLPLLYILMGLSFCLLLIIYKPGFTWPGLIIALLGIPLYYIAGAGKAKRTGPPAA